MSNLTTQEPLVPPGAETEAAVEAQTVNQLLAQILSTKRAHGSTGDTNFRLWLFRELKQLGLKPEISEPGNILVKVEKGGTTLFSCHIDTVHGSAESNGSLQGLSFDPAFGHLFLENKQLSGCLGADDGVGIYILLRMIAAKKPGYYIFHVGEGRGGLGTKAFVAGNRQFLQDIEAVVAFDRAVKDEFAPEVIITQGGRPCASKAYGEALADALNAFPFLRTYETSTGGVYTDSKEYASDVPECVNVGCFYNRQHTPEEYVDVYELEKLVDAVIAIDWNKLPIVRKPAIYTPAESGKFAGYKAFPGYSQGSDEDDIPLFAESFRKPKGSAPAAAQPPTTATAQQISARASIEAFEDYAREDFLDFATTEPDAAAACLMLLYVELQAANAKVALFEQLLELD